MKATEQPKFSVVIPTYNREKLIPQTLDTVFAQTYPHYEIIVVDNCSTDNTEEILKPLIDDGRIRFIKHERNYERARSRNTGMENATGDFVTFLDSDDLMYPDCLSDAAEFVRQNPDVKCFHNLYDLVNDRREVVYKYDFPPLDDQLKAIVNGNFLSCIGNFIHRDIYRKYRFDTCPELTGAEDWEFWLQVLADYELKRIEKINGAIVHHESRSINAQNLQGLEKGYNHLFKKYRSDEHLRKAYAKYLNRIEASSYMYMAFLTNMGGLFDETRRYLKLAAQSDKSVLFSVRFLNLLRRAVFKMQIK